MTGSENAPSMQTASVSTCRAAMQQHCYTEGAEKKPEEQSQEVPEGAGIK